MGQVAKATSPPPKVTWGTLANAPQQHSHRPSSKQKLHTPSATSSGPPPLDAFPQLQTASNGSKQQSVMQQAATAGHEPPSWSSASKEFPASSSAGPCSLSRRGSKTPDNTSSSTLQPHAHAVRRSSSAMSFVEVAKDGQQQRGRHQQQHGNEKLKHTPHVASPVQPVAGCGPVDVHWLQDAVHELCMLHAWCDEELVTGIMHSVDFDLQQAEAILTEMAGAGSYGQHTNKPGLQTQHQTMHGIREADVRVQEDDPSSTFSLNKQQQDIYHKHRHDAIRLTHAWQKALRRCVVIGRLAGPMLICSDMIKSSFAYSYRFALQLDYILNEAPAPAG